jgi:hypothetical protein
LASQQSFSTARVPFSTICPFGGLSCWVHSLAVKVQVSSTPTVSRHAFTLLAFEPVTSLNSSAKAVSEVQASAVKTKSNDALLFSGKSIKSFKYKSSFIFQVVVASFLTNNASSFDDKSSTVTKLVVASVKNEDSNGQTNDSPDSACTIVVGIHAKHLLLH